MTVYPLRSPELNRNMKLITAVLCSVLFLVIHNQNCVLSLESLTMFVERSTNVSGLFLMET